MAVNKKGFLLYADQYELFNQLTDEKAGQLIKHIFAYVNDEEPETKDIIINLAFTPIKQQLKRDLKKFEEIKLKRSIAGKKSAEKRAKQNSTSVESVQQSSTNSTSVKSVEQTSTNSTDNDNDNVNVIVNDISKEKNIKKKKVGFSFRKSLCDLGIKKELVDDFIKNRKLKRLANTETAFKNLKIEFSKTGAEINELMNFVVSKGWGSFKNSWLEKEKKTFNSEEKSKIQTHFEANEGAKKILGIDE